MSRKSSILKMLQNEAPHDRQINKFPKCCYHDTTPYEKTDFSEKTRKVCSNSVIISALKICKVIVIGDVSVGKTSIVNRFCQKLFDSNYKATIGVDFEVERFDILNVPFNLQIWDTAGQERFRSIAQSYYRGAQAVIIVFDMTNTLSLVNTKNWIHEALSVSNEAFRPYVFLVGSKKDLLSPAAVKNVETSGLKTAKKLNAEFWTVSARTGHNIQQLFSRIVALVFDDFIQMETERPTRKQIGANDIISFNNNESCKLKKTTIRAKCAEVKCSIT